MNSCNCSTLLGGCGNYDCDCECHKPEEEPPYCVLCNNECTEEELAEHGGHAVCAQNQ